MGGFEAGFGGNGAAAGGGQTREHAQLARSLGIDQLAVVISKLDTCCFSQVLELPINAQNLLPPERGAKALDHISWHALKTPSVSAVYLKA